MACNHNTATWCATPPQYQYCTSTLHLHSGGLHRLHGGEGDAVGLHGAVGFPFPAPSGFADHFGDGVADKTLSSSVCRCGAGSQSGVAETVCVERMGGGHPSPVGGRPAASVVRDHHNWIGSHYFAAGDESTEAFLMSKSIA